MSREFIDVPLTWDEIEQIILALQNWQHEYKDDDSFEGLIAKLRSYRGRR